MIRTLLVMLGLSLGQYSKGQGSAKYTASIFLQPYMTTFSESKSFASIPYDYVNICNLAKLQPIDKITDSVSIRLWISHMFGAELITIMKTNVNWDLHYSKYKSKATFKEQTLKSKISLGKFVDRIKLIDFKTIVSQKQIKDFNDDVDDGITYTLEYGLPNYHKIVEYHSPNSFKDSDNKKFEKIIRLFDLYFHPE